MISTTEHFVLKSKFQCKSFPKFFQQMQKSNVISSDATQCVKFSSMYALFVLVQFLLLTENVDESLKNWAFWRHTNCSAILLKQRFVFFIFQRFVRGNEQKRNQTTWHYL